MPCAVWCCNGATNLWTIKIKSLYMLWSQYKLATIRRTEFLRKEITGIPNITNQNSVFLTLQTSEFQKKVRPESSESNMESEFRLQWGSQKPEPKIGIPNQAFWTLSLSYTFKMSSLSDDILNVVAPDIGTCTIKTRKNIRSLSDNILNVVTMWRHLKCCHLMTIFLVSLSWSDWFGLSQRTHPFTWLAGFNSDHLFPRKKRV